MAAYFFASPVDVDVKLESEDVRKQVDVKLEKERTISCPVYYDGDSVGGTVCHSTLACLSETQARSVENGARLQYGFVMGRS